MKQFPLPPGFPLQNQERRGNGASAGFSAIQQQLTKICKPVQTFVDFVLPGKIGAIMAVAYGKFLKCAKE
jgi:hypothetical protein